MNECIPYLQNFRVKLFTCKSTPQQNNNGCFMKNNNTAGVRSANKISGYDWPEINATHHAKCFHSISVMQQTLSKSYFWKPVSCSLFVRWLMWLRSGLAQVGGLGAQQPPPPALRWTWRSSRSTCRSTLWRSILRTLLLHLRPLCLHTHTHTPTRAPGSQVSVAGLQIGLSLCLYIYFLLTVSFDCFSVVNSWSGKHPYEWHSHTPHEEYDEQALHPAWPSPHDNQWVSSRTLFS